MRKSLSLVTLLVVLLSLWPVSLINAEELPPSEIETDVWLEMTCEGGTAGIQNLSSFGGVETVQLFFDDEVVGEHDVTLSENQTLEEAVAWADLGVSLPLLEAHTVAIATNDAQASATVGPCEEPPAPEPGSITVHKFEDANLNGVQDEGEQDLEGWPFRLYLLDGSTHLFAEGASEPDGVFTFTEVPPGTYKVWEANQECWEATTPGNDWDGGHYQVFSLEEGDSLTVEFGNAYTCEPPPLASSIDVEKYVSVDGQATWEDADTPPGPEVIVGSDVYFKFEVANSGDTELTGVTLSDDLFDAEIAECDVPDVLASGDSFECLIGPFEAVEGQHVNQGLATGSHGGETYSDADYAKYYGVAEPGSNPDYTFVKYVNGQDANTVDEAVEVNVGDGLVFRYEVFNTGDVPLEWIGLTDDVLGDLAELCYFPTLVGVGESAYCEVTDIAAVFPEGKKNVGTPYVTVVDSPDLLPEFTDPAWYKTPSLNLGCTYCQGYWRDHPEIWPVDELVLGSRTYTETELLALLDTPTTSDASLSLAHQLIGAKLNVAGGADDGDVADTIVAADQWLVDNDDGDGLPCGVEASTTEGQEAMLLADLLEAYNMGIIGPGHCDDGGPSGPVSPGPGGPGLYVTPLYTEDYLEVGQVSVWNSREKLHIKVEGTEGWKLYKIEIYVGAEPAPTVYGKAMPDPSQFPYREIYAALTDNHTLVLDLQDDLGFSWGQPYEDLRIQNVAVRAKLFLIDPATWTEGADPFEDGLAWKYSWAFGSQEFENDWSWWSTYELAHPRRGHFIDAPVGGLHFQTPTNGGRTNESGAFDYFPGERVDLSVGSLHLGTPLAGHKVSPLDIFEESGTNDPRVVNVARLLQSLDVDGEPQGGISITQEVEVCLDQAMVDLGLTDVDFADDAQVEAVIQGTIDACDGVEGVTLVAVSAEAAKANLDKALDSNMFRKNISRTPDLTSTKSKLNIMRMWFPALRANNDPAYYYPISTTTEITETGIPYYDESGNLIRVADEAKPIVVVYTDGVEETGYEDVFAAISRDDGNTWKRTNLSRAADRSSFVLANGEDYYGEAKKPVFGINGNNILVAWTSKFCNGGRPTYAIVDCDLVTDDPETPENEYEQCLAEDYVYDDPYYEDDIWGVGGPQRSVDYSEGEGPIEDYPEVGEVPYSCVWVARGTIVTQGMINSPVDGGFWSQYDVGEVVWFKPERLTSGRRDAIQVFMGTGDGAGFGVSWQEDPEGLRPGQMLGPGHGWSGATVNHKTDIWYTYITQSSFRRVDTHFEAGGDPQHDDEDFIGRPKALVPMPLPVRISDNDVVNTDNLMVELDEDGYPVEDEFGNWIPITNPDTDGEGDGTHRYGYEIPGLCVDFYEFTNQQGELKRVCITEDGRLLDGDTGASRPNLFLQPFTKPDGSKSAWAILAYEETKGVGAGPPDHEDGGEAPEDGTGDGNDQYFPDAGKNVIYHSFEFVNPDTVSAGDIVNLPERDEEGNLIYLHPVMTDTVTGEPLKDDEGNWILSDDYLLDWQGNPQLAYENARRPRFILQGKSAIGSSRTVMLIIYKEGSEGQGRQSDIMLRRVVVPGGQTGNPYRFSNIACDAWVTALNGETVCADGTQNMSSVTPTVYWTNPEAEPDAKGDQTKVVEWVQLEENLDDRSFTNPYDDARAHRGQIRGDFVVMGYTWTPNWASARNAHDKYDFYIRRSFDGGQTWTTDPLGSGVWHTDTFKIYEEDESEDDDLGREKYTISTFYGPGEFEPALNLSQLPNNKESVIEPRVVSTPGTIKDPATGEWTGIPEDKQNPNIFYVSYGTATNVPKPHGNADDEDEELLDAVPLDLYYSFSLDKGETYVEVEWVVNGDPTNPEIETGDVRTGWDWLAKGDPEQGEAQLRMTPDGSRFYATWVQDGEEGSDIWFRRIMPPEFSCNVSPDSIDTDGDGIPDWLDPFTGRAAPSYKVYMPLLLRR